jgi:hypothetical protein
MSGMRDGGVSLSTMGRAGMRGGFKPKRRS